MTKYKWIVHTPRGTCEVSSFAKAIDELKSRKGPAFASLTHRRFLRRKDKIYYPDGYAIERYPAAEQRDAKG